MAESTGATADVSAASNVVERCSCGRIATARCWLGENSPARWLFGCHRQGLLPGDASEAA